LEECGPRQVLASYTLAFALQPRKKHGKTSDFREDFIAKFLGKKSTDFSLITSDIFNGM
jgi:hypothetical protein